jgi:hypothetical protein
MTAKIAAALHAVMEEVSYVQKTGKNTFHNYKYAGEADLLEKLRPAMLKHGLLLLPSVRAVTCDDHANYTVLMDYTLVHKDGDVWPVTIGAAGCGSDKSKTGTVGDKGVYKAITGANKYLLFKLFQIETGDDPEVTSPGEGVQPAAPYTRASFSSGIGPGKDALPITDAGNGDDGLVAHKYLMACLKVVEVSTGPRAKLIEWWRGEAEKRRKYNLTQEQIDQIRQAIEFRFPAATALEKTMA